MKKLLLLMLVLLGGVMQVSAKDYYVSGDNRILPSNEDWGIRSENKMHATSVANVYALVVTNVTVLAKDDNNDNTKYLFKFVEKDGETETWYGYDGGTGNTTLNFSYGGTYTIVFYYDAANHKGRFIATPMLRWDLGNSGNGNWSWTYEEASMLTRDGDFSWTMEITPAKFTKDTSLRIYSAAWDKSAYPNGKDIALTYGGASVNSAYFNYTSSTEWSWKVSKPSYPFNKIKITATYKPFDTTNGADFGQWEVKADAYISKTVVNNDYSTLGCSVPLDITSLPNGITAYTLSTTGKTINKEVKTTTLLENKGVLLHNTSGENKTLSIPVAASGTADENNQLVAFTGSGKLTQPTSGNNTYYILTDMNNKVGFYKVNSSGNTMGANTAYLVVDGSTLARDFFALDGETTGIANVDVNDNFDANAPMYNLAGQRVSKNYKGVVIVNGKKMLNK